MVINDVSEESDEKQVKDEYNEGNGNSEPKVDDTYKRCMTRTAWNKKEENGEDGK